MLLNNVGILANRLNYKLNERYYLEAMSQKRGIRAYSLGERYQIAENIRACRFFNSTVLWVGFLNMIASQRPEAIYSTDKLRKCEPQWERI
ncbi:hypothetical protein OSTOST_11581, partial [Ostertagia ostertagi]